MNPGMTERIERSARRAGAQVVGRVRYDSAVSRAQLMGRAVVETASAAAADVRRLWELCARRSGRRPEARRMRKGKRGSAMTAGNPSRYGTERDPAPPLTLRTLPELSFVAEGLWARLVQHEVDHLNGRLISDYASAAVDAGRRGT